VIIVHASKRFLPDTEAARRLVYVAVTRRARKWTLFGWRALTSTCPFGVRAARRVASVENKDVPMCRSFREAL
jgi:hypothetical protein